MRNLMVNRPVMGLLLAASLASPVWAAPIAQAQTELKGSPEELRNFLHPRENIISLSASAEETAYSDEATLSLVVTTEEKALAQSIEKNAALRDSIRATLLKSGIKVEDINNSKFSSSPQYGWFGKKPSSFEVVNRVAIKITTEEQLKTVAKLADEHEEIILGGTEFKHSAKEEFEKKVKEEALNKILAEQKVYESKLGVKLTPVAFYDQPIQFAATRGAFEIEEVVVQRRQKSNDSYAAEAFASSPVSQQAISFDEVTYRANIRVEFKVESAR